MKLYVDGVEAQKGMKVKDFKGSDWYLVDWREPRSESSSGRVFVKKNFSDDQFKIREFFPSVINAKFVYEDMQTETNSWIDVDVELPKPNEYLLLSFSNFSIPVVGRYEEDEEGGAFHIGDELETCVSQDLFVNAWMPLPKPYRPNEN